MATSSNILFLPFRKSHSVALSDAIKQYISSKYDQHPDMFKQDLEVIDDMRRDAVNVKEAHVSGIKKIAAYAAQLTWIGGKFPIDIGVDFTWYPALGYNTERPVSQNNLKFELANVLFNLAALYSQLAVATYHGTSEGLKSASQYFCLAAGVISHIKSVVIPELRSTPPEDMDIATLESVQQLLLAQAQECFWQKAVLDGYKDATIAKLAARVSDLYSSAGDWGIKSESVSSEWIHHMTAKHHHFAAAAQYRQACDCLERRRYGEEVARLRDSLVCVNEALKEARYINKMVLADLQGLKNKVQEDLRRAEKDNDLIYLNPVPPKSELRTLDRANMAVAKIPQEVAEPSAFIGDRKEFGRPLFAHLVPYAVHLAASIYEERRDRLVNSSIVSELEILTTKIHDALLSLNLPGSLQALEKPLGLPPSVLSHAEEIRQADAIRRLERSFGETAKLKASGEAVFNEGRDVLNAERIEDEQLRLRYGTERWTRPDSKTAAEKLYTQVSEIEGYLRSAEKSDNLVQTKYVECESMLRVLSGTNREIEEFVPSARRVHIPPKLEAEASKLRSRLNDVARMESRRRRKVESIQEKAKRDDINKAILEEAARLEREYPGLQIAPAQFEDFFEQRLRRYDPDIEDVRAEVSEQDQLLGLLAGANADFVAASKGDTSSKEREQALQKLESVYYKYKEIVSNLEVGRKFYNDLSKIVGRFMNDCKTFAYSRRTEAAQLEAELSLPPISNLTLQQQEPQQSRPTTRSHQKPERQTGNVPVLMAAPVATRAPIAPMQSDQAPPGGMWSPEVGIRFGGPASSQKPPPAGTKPQAGEWNPSAGIRFG